MDKKFLKNSLVIAVMLGVVHMEVRADTHIDHVSVTQTAEQHYTGKPISLIQASLLALSLPIFLYERFLIF